MADRIGTGNPRTMICRPNGFNNTPYRTNLDQNNFSKSGTIFTKNLKAFTLIELLVVISIILLLMCILLPVLVVSRSKSNQLVCKSNIRQLLLANTNYASDNDGHYVRAASDIFEDNKHRWYGTRNNINDPFDPNKGPLATHLGQTYVKCPTKVNYLSTNPSESYYEEGSGGYGYNMIYIGSRIWTEGYEAQSCKVSAAITEISQPAQTIMFADTAMARNGNYIQYSFAEPRFFVVNGKPVVGSGWNPSPSIHFRHLNWANICWVDGHVTAQKMAKYEGVNFDGTKPADWDLGWFNPMDNSLFDLK